jgi:hypothetical protein
MQCEVATRTINLMSFQPAMHAAIIAAFAASAAFAACACCLPFRRLPPPLVTRMLQKRRWVEPHFGLEERS